MSSDFVTGVLGRVFIVRWVNFHLLALAAVREEIVAARRLLGRRLVYLSLIPSTPHAFTDQERDILGAYLKDLLLRDCDSIHHVIAGAGFAASARRSIVTNLALSAARAEVFHTYPDLDASLVAIAALVGKLPEELNDEAKRRGLDFPKT